MTKINPIFYFRKLKWSSRKLLLPIPRKSLVLEVGSGGNPHPYANVLVEKYISNKHRLKPIEIDSRLILADACNMPFKDETFDYSLSFHVLEHVHNPANFLDEMNRTSKAGYIETPNFLYERLVPFDVHLLEIALINSTLHIRKKESAYPDEYITSLEYIKNNTLWQHIFENRPDLFHTQYYWKEKINYLIHNNKTDTSWFEDPKSNHTENAAIPNTTSQKSLRKFFIDSLKSTRKNNIDIGSILVCPQCKKPFTKETRYYICKKCKIKFNSTPVPDFTKTIPL